MPFFVCISIDCLSERASGRPSPVSAAKDDTTDENGDKHIHLLDAETRPFVSSNAQLYVILFGVGTEGNRNWFSARVL